MRPGTVRGVPYEEALRGGSGDGVTSAADSRLFALAVPPERHHMGHSWHRVSGLDTFPHLPPPPPARRLDSTIWLSWKRRRRGGREGDRSFLSQRRDDRRANRTAATTGAATWLTCPACVRPRHSFNLQTKAKVFIQDLGGPPGGSLWLLEEGGAPHLEGSRLEFVLVQEGGGKSLPRARKGACLAQLAAGGRR